MTSEHPRFSLDLKRISGYQFETNFDWEAASLLLDEPAPLGESKGPNASRLVGAAVGNCLSASLLFCLQKSKQTVRSLHTHVEGELIRNERGRLRLGQIEVTITLDVESEQPQRVKRCLDLFEDYCVVTASIRKGVPVRVAVKSPRGELLYQAE